MRSVPFYANVYRVLIMSPDDLAGTRAAMAQAVTAWNDLNSEAYRTVLMPTVWEIGASPMAGDPPRVLLERGIVDVADVVIGMFWTRIAAPDNEDASAAIEGVERKAANGDPVLLYFSNRPVGTSPIDPEQLEKVRALRRSVAGRSLVAEFASDAELAHAAQRHLTHVVYDLELSATRARPRRGPVDNDLPSRRDERLARLLTEHQVRLRTLVMSERTNLRQAVGASDVDGTRRCMGTLARYLARYVETISTLSERASASALLVRLADVTGRSARLDRAPEGTPGSGATWERFLTEAEAVFDELESLVEGDWVELASTRA
jgi:hypothetical protein